MSGKRKRRAPDADAARLDVARTILEASGSLHQLGLAALQGSGEHPAIALIKAAAVVLASLPPGLTPTIGVQPATAADIPPGGAPYLYIYPPKAGEPDWYVLEGRDDKGNTFACDVHFSAARRRATEAEIAATRAKSPASAEEAAPHALPARRHEGRRARLLELEPTEEAAPLLLCAANGDGRAST